MYADYTAIGLLRFTSEPPAAALHREQAESAQPPAQDKPKNPVSGMYDVNLAVSEARAAAAPYIHWV